MWLSSGNDIISTTPQAFYRYSLATRRRTPLLEGDSEIAPEFSIAPDEKSLYSTLQRSTAEIWIAARRPSR